MKKVSSRLLLIIPLLMFMASVQPSQAANVETLERKLLERDKVILELLERIETLERRVGVERSISRTRDLDQNEETRVRSPDQAPGAIVVEEGVAERALELSLTREGALLLPPGILNVETRLTYVRQEDRTPIFLYLGDDVFPGETELNANSLTADIQLRLGLPWDTQVEVGLPYRWRNIELVNNSNFAPLDKSTESGSAFGDLRIGLAKTLVREGLYRPDLIGRINWDTDTGNKHDNGVPLGGGFHELSGSLTAIKRQDPVAFIGELAYEYTFEENEIQPGAVVSSLLGGNIALSPETSLGLFLGAAYQNETKLYGSRIEGSDRTVGTFQLVGPLCWQEVLCSVSREESA